MKSTSQPERKPTVTPRKQLFWFLRDGIKFDLSDSSVLDMYVQQVICRGGEKDVKNLLKVTDSNRLKQALKRMEYFIPDEVRGFWEDFFNENHQ